MREIKFRAWNKDKKVMSRIFDLWSCMFEEKLLWVNPEDLIVMQYTGLKDKNGKEIYEGDIIKFICLSAAENKTRIQVVEWDENTGFFPFTECSYPWLGYDCGGDIENGTVEVIGNIYENPELLKND
jgi:uncharacterized phage protein (TIGR01671 family)